jgi:hypothetical protein
MAFGGRVLANSLRTSKLALNAARSEEVPEEEEEELALIYEAAFGY